ncbi:MAG: hypothetical protein H7343_09130 [Undibacterium sp.]|nr:hypothetical protein [Opitutaceae bacterium]
MKPDDHNPSWARLTAAARRAPFAGDTAAPYGFATRVAALAFAAERPMRSLFERFSLRAVGVASLLAVLSVVANYSVLTVEVAEEDYSVAGEDPVALLLGPIE